MNRYTGYIRHVNPLYVAIGLSILMLVAVIIKDGAVVYEADTESYIIAWDRACSHGELDIFRTPVYPVLIGAGRWVFGADNWGLLPLFLQVTVFYGCGIAFSKMIRGVISNRIAAWIAVFAYFLYIPIVKALPVMGTEALAYSLTALWMYCVWRFLQKAGWGSGIAIALLTLTAVMLRPAFLLLAVVIAGIVIAGIFMRDYRRQVLLLLLTLIPTAVIYNLYAKEIGRQTGVETISVVTIINNYFMARQYNDIYPEFLPDNPRAIEVMEEYRKEGDPLSYDYNMRQWEEIEYIENNEIMTYREMLDYSMAMKKHYPGVWYRYVAQRIADSFKAYGPVRNAFNYLITGLYSLLFLFTMLRWKRFSIINFMTLMIGGGSLLSIFLYAQQDFSRLMLPTTAALILMGGQLLSCIRLHPFSINTLRFFPKDKN